MPNPKHTPKVPIEEIIHLFDFFINDHGLWQEFKKFLEDRGYTPSDLGLDDDD